MIGLNAAAVLLAASKKSSSSSGTSLIILLLVVGVALYFIFWRPQQQKARKQREANSAIELGDEIVTVGGLVATVVEMEGDRVTVETAGESGAPSRLVFVRTAISRKAQPVTPEPAADDHAELELGPRPDAHADGGDVDAEVDADGDDGPASDATAAQVADGDLADGAVDGSGDTSPNGNGQVRKTRRGNGSRRSS